MNERGLVGPMLASLIVCMAQRMRLSRRHSQEFLHDWLGISLSTSTINRCIHEAGHALRHWVIARQISQGRRTEQGTRAFGLLANVIETCRKRKILPWPYLAKVIAARRKGNPVPSFASAALAA